MHGTSSENDLLEVREILAWKASGASGNHDARETVEELEANIKDAYHAMILDDVPRDHQTKEISV